MEGDGCLQRITDKNGENAPLMSGALCDPCATVVVQSDEGDKVGHKRLCHDGKQTFGPWVAAKHTFVQNICEFVIAKFQVKKKKGNFL